MFATLLAALAVVIALQALRLASRDRIVIQVRPEEALNSKKPQLPHFLNQPRSERPAAEPPAPRPVARPAEPEQRIEISFLQGRPLDVHPN